MRLPPGMHVLERGWLSSNNVLLVDGERAAIVDTGYVTHAPQTLALVRHALDGRRLAHIVNTHSHADHVGGNAALHAAHGARITVPAGIATAVAAWDEDALMLAPADQQGARFAHDDTYAAGDELELGGLVWRAHAAPGHDMDALVLHCAEQRVLISGDALWREGFGIIFAEVLARAEGLRGVRETLDRIARLPIDVVVPGHGAPFDDVDAAITRAYARLAAFEEDGTRMARNALRALFVFALMQRGSMARAAVAPYLERIPVYGEINRRYFQMTSDVLAAWLIRDLERAGAVRLESDRLVAAGGV